MFYWEREMLMYLLKPSSPNIHIKILLTEPRKFPQRISEENLLKGQSILNSLLVINSSILMIFSLDYVFKTQIGKITSRHV